MSDVSNNPQTAGIRFRQGTCLDATSFTAYAPVKLTGPNTYEMCDGTGADTDNDIAGVVLADRQPGQTRSVPIALLSSDVPLPVLVDGSGVVTAGTHWLTLSTTVAGKFEPSASGTGVLRAVTSGAAAAGVVLACGLSGAGGGGGGSYPAPSITADAVSAGAIAIDGSIMNTVHLVALSASATLAITAPVAGETYVFVVTNAGAFAITWPGTFTWPGGAAPTLTTSGVDVITAIYDGTSYEAVAALAYS